jgi:NADP-dependent 3-hydroxy acid dehydrogenase YdfG
MTRALIVGVGPGLSSSFARLLARAGHKVALAARDIEKLQPLAAEIGATLHPCDAADPAAVAALFEAVPDAAVVSYRWGLMAPSWSRNRPPSAWCWRGGEPFC